MFVSDKILYELNRNASFLIVSSVKTIFAGDGITRLSCHRLLQFKGVNRRCEFKILDIFQRLTGRNGNLYELPEVAIGITITLQLEPENLFMSF